MKNPTTVKPFVFHIESLDWAKQWAKFFSIFGALLFLSGCAVWTGGLPPSSNETERYPIIASIHGIKKITYSDDLHQIVVSYIPTNEIPRDTNNIHGWLIQIQPAEKPIKGREVYILPKPAHWKTASVREISIDRTTCVTDFIVPKGAKYVSDEWGMFSDDPLGKYQFVVFLDDKLAAKFEFNVIEGPQKANEPKQK